MNNICSSKEFWHDGWRASARGHLKMMRQAKDAEAFARFTSELVRILECTAGTTKKNIPWIWVSTNNQVSIWDYFSSNVLVCPTPVAGTCRCLYRYRVTRGYHEWYPVTHPSSFGNWMGTVVRVFNVIWPYYWQHSTVWLSLICVTLHHLPRFDVKFHQEEGKMIFHKKHYYTYAPTG